MEKKMFKVWSEGYAATGQAEKAKYHGECLAETFIDACIILCGNILDKNPDGSICLNSKGNPMIWACGMYDNEEDARKYFG